MKVALLLTGLARKVREGHNQYWKSVIETYNPDVYLHCWKDEEYELVSETYPNHKKLIVEEPFSFKQYTVGVTADDEESRPTEPYGVKGNFRALPMFWSWQKMAREITESYDVIIRSRYDLGWHHPLNLDGLDFERLNICDKHWSGSDIPDDNLMITNNQNFHKFFDNCFDNLVKHIEKHKHLNFQEKNLMVQLKEQNMFDLVTKTSKLDFKLLRNNQVWY
jgi:hypothetical protein